MAALRIPPDDQHGLVKLALLPDDAASRLRDAIGAAARRVGIGLSDEDVTPNPSSLAPDVESDDLKMMVEAVVNINLAKAYSESDLEDFVEDVSESMRSAPGFPTSKEAIAHFRVRIQQFLTINELSLSAKSSFLRHEHERTAHSFRILTDVRPIFGESVEQAPEAAVIMHTLKIAYHSGARLDEAFFGMDEADLQVLKELVARAEAKAKSIRTAVSGQLKVLTDE